MNQAHSLIDSHCHLDFPEFDENRAAIWRACQNAGIGKAVIPGVSPEQWLKSKAICESYLGLFYAVGLHPWWIEKFFKQDEKVDELCNRLERQLHSAIQSEKCVAIGECGVDLLIDTPLEVQLSIMRLHLKVAHETAKPVIVHCRKAHNNVIAELRQQKRVNRFLCGVVHGFSGSWDLAQQYWSLGFYIGVGGTITYERANKTREAVKKINLESILLETDAPDMPLQGEQGQRNSPLELISVAKCLAELRGEPLSKIADQTSINAFKLFGFSS